MGWTKSTRGDGTTEWDRTDGNANIRIRRRYDGTFTVRLDRLFQAPEGQFYRRETAQTEEAAKAISETWRAEFDVSE